MLKVIGVLVALSVSALVAAQDSTLIVTLHNVPSADGQVLVALYNRADDWNKPELAKYVRKAPAEQGAISLAFAHLAPGNYAIAALHDADDSGKMSFTIFGMPKEAYGFGNNARAVFSAPAYEDCLIEFDGRGKTHIVLK